MQTSSINLLCRHWWTKKRRTFRWSDIALSLYIYTCVLAGFIGYWAASGTSPADIMSLDTSGGAAWYAVILLLPDLIAKLVTKHDVTLMDDYLKSKPIDMSSWNAFVALQNLADIWNYTVVVPFAAFALLTMPLGRGLATTLLLLTTSLVTGMMKTCICRASTWDYKTMPYIGWVLWAFTCLTVAFNPLRLGWVAQMATFVAINLLCMVLFYLYLCMMPSYYEPKLKASHVHGRLRGSLFANEYVSIVRAKRLRIMAIMGFFFATFEIYGSADMMDNEYGRALVATFIGMPALFIGQWVFCLEANFFDGLWTKPINVKNILTNKYYFCGLATLLTTIIYLPAVFIHDNITPTYLAASATFSLGGFNLAVLPSCLYARRFEIFEGGLFNMQGNSLKISFYGLGLALSPSGVYALVTFLPEAASNAILFAIGLLGLLVHRPVLGMVANAWQRKRHEHLDEYRK